MNIHPQIIQGGMGAGVSSWRLARAVSKTGQLGVVSGTALDNILVRRLQDGDPGRHMRRALDRCPLSGIAERIWDQYFVPGGKPSAQSYPTLPMHRVNGPRELVELCIVANFVEVALAREGHDHPVGINFLEKIQLPHLPSIYGAMLAGVDYVLMGAGIPAKVPGVLDRFVHHEAATYPLQVSGAVEGETTMLEFDPRAYMPVDPSPLKRPKFIAIVSSHVLAATLVKKSNGAVDGFVVEGPTAGGHNAPPRGRQPLSPTGEPVYGERDAVNLDKMREIGLPFWLAGGFGRAAKLAEALRAGAAGVQVGTAFAFCAESALREDHKQRLLGKAQRGEALIFTDPLASPTGFPFKVARLQGSLSEPEVYAARPRICDLGYLREAYRTADGGVGFRCAGEPVTTYLAKGGRSEDTEGRKCICNALVANIGQPQIRAGRLLEPPLVTSGDDLAELTQFVKTGGPTYTAADVIRTLLSAPVDVGPTVLHKLNSALPA